MQNKIAILKKRPITLTVGGILTNIYGHLYIVLQLEDYALLMSRVDLFVVLFITMFIFR